MILFAILALPLLAAFISWLPLGRKVAPAITFSASIAAMILAGKEALIGAAGQPVVAVVNWIELDGLSALMLLIVAAVGMTAALFSWGYVAREQEAQRLRRYYSNYNCFVFAMLAVPIVVEPALVWTAVELTTIVGI